MSNVTINQLPTASTIDASADILPIYTASQAATQGISRNTLLGITGSPVGNSDSQTLTNKTIGNTNTITQKDGSNFTLQNASDTSKQLRFSLSSITTSTTRTLTVPDVTDTIVTLGASQTLTNKTLTSPTINSPTITNATISTDTITGYSASTTGTVFGVTVTSGGLTSPSITTPKITTGLKDSNNNSMLGFNPTGSAVNYFQFTNAATAGIPAIAAVGSDSNIALQLSGKGTGAVEITQAVMFSAYRSSAQTINTSMTKVQFDTEDFDAGSNYDNATNYRFTAPITGYYIFRAFIGWGSTASMTRAIMELYKNGSTYVRIGDDTNLAASAGGIGGIVPLSLAANDYIEIFVQSIGASFSCSSGTGPRITSFSGYFVGV